MSILKKIKYSCFTNILKRIKYYGVKAVKIKNYGYGHFKRYICGKNNTIRIGKNSYLNNCLIRICGNNNKLIIGENCIFGPECSFWLEGNDTEIIIGDNTTCTRRVQFCAQEDKSVIKIGKDCMFANTINVRTSDSHPIYDSNMVRINNAENVEIGDHVWCCPDVKILKGVKISDGCVIGSNSVVTRNIELTKSLAVGIPAKIIKENIFWTREVLF